MKANTKAITPKNGERFSFPEDFESQPEFQRQVYYFKTFDWESYMTIHDDDNNLSFKIYTPHFSIIFTRAETELFVSPLSTLRKVKTYPLFQKFKEGYLKGLEHFDKNYKVSGEVLYGLNAVVYERTLHRLYFHGETNKISTEWVNYTKNYPIVFTFDELYKYGYYSGLISCVKELRRNHPLLFEKFDLCNIERKHEDTNSELKYKDELMELIILHLKPLNGLWRGESIMTDNDFDKLVTNTKYLLENNKLPTGIKSIKSNKSTNPIYKKNFC
ncbi:MAG: hypothetical protein IPO63_14105 [Bacteroidetes bacterium]|nr:hypothetical protein [Bacteroidota bacterium]